MTFQVTSRKLDESVHVVSVTGEADLYTAPELKRQLIDVIGDGAANVVVDLTDTTFIDSTILGVLVGAMKRVRARDGDLQLVCIDPNIRRIFEITLLDRAFTIHETQAEALVDLGLVSPDS